MSQFIFICGTLERNSKLYSQCLRDILTVSTSCIKQKQQFTFEVDDSPAGILAGALIRSAQLSVEVRTSDLAIPRATLILVYIEDPERDAHYEEKVYDLQAEGCEVYVRSTPRPAIGLPKVTEPEGDGALAEYRRAAALVQRRIRPIPTRGPQVWREIEIRPNGGKPWFYV